MSTRDTFRPTAFADARQRLENRERVNEWPKDAFDCYQDWFFFAHVHSWMRYWHALGMVVGLVFYALMFLAWGWMSLPYYLIATFFFYGSGMISHWYYLGGAGLSERQYVRHTFPTVIRINYLTMTGQFDSHLEKFVEKYPFVAKTYDLTDHPCWSPDGRTEANESP